MHPLAMAAVNTFIENYRIRRKLATFTRRRGGVWSFPRARRVCPSVPTRSLTGFSVRTVSEARGRYARAFLMNTYLVGWVDGITMSTPRLWFSACVAAMSTSEIEYGVAFWESRIHNVDPTKA